MPTGQVEGTAGQIEGTAIALPSATTPVPLLEAFVLADPDVRDRLRRWLMASLGREVEILDEHERSFKWQYGVSRIIFFVVHVLLGVALIASLMEFTHAWRMRRRARAEQHELKVGMEGVALKTSLQGLLLLVVATVFYFLYLSFVYPITVVGA